MTLLMGFFALMLSFSKVDQDEFEKVRLTAVESFGGEYQLPHEELKKALERALSDLGLAETVTVEANARGVTLTFEGTVFFDSGSATLRPQGQAVVEQIIPVIRQLAVGFWILVEGHTDDVPISRGVVESNWELSGLRASRVARVFEAAQFDRQRLMTLGWGETRPLLPPTDAQGQPIAENRAKNRRVVIKVLSGPPM
jgi:chemotaxis protein MotB